MTATRTLRGALNVELTRTGAALGTPAYMSPEQFRNERTDARTNQFSFCVALYEALYDERPFLGAQLAGAVGGRSAAAWCRRRRRGSRFPGGSGRRCCGACAAIRTGRWPSMRALLSELDRSIRRSRTGAASSPPPPKSWRGSGRRRAARRRWRRRPRRRCAAAFLASGKGYAAKAWEGAGQILDRYARRWTELYVEACEATHVREEQSAEVLDLRMACLRQGLEDLRALVQMFRQPTAEVIENAVERRQRARQPRTLREHRASARGRPTARGSDHAPGGRPAALAGWRRCARSAASGASTKGSRRRRRWSAPPRALQYGPLLAEVLLAISRLPEEQGDMVSAVRISEEAMLTALACRHEEAAAEAATCLVGHAGYGVARTEVGTAEAWCRIAEALLRRIGGHDLLVGLALHQPRGSAGQAGTDRRGARRRAVVGRREGEGARARSTGRRDLPLQRGRLPRRARPALRGRRAGRRARWRSSSAGLGPTTRARRWCCRTTANFWRAAAGGMKQRTPLPARCRDLRAGGRSGRDVRLRQPDGARDCPPRRGAE